MKNRVIRNLMMVLAAQLMIFSINLCPSFSVIRLLCIPSESEKHKNTESFGLIIVRRLL